MSIAQNVLAALYVKPTTIYMYKEFQDSMEGFALKYVMMGFKETAFAHASG